MLTENDVFFRTDLNFSRFYDSQDFTSLGATTLRSYVLGANWRHSFQRFILTGDGASAPIVVRDDGSRIGFKAAAGGTWKGPSHRFERLSGSSASGWIYTTASNDLEQYDNEGKLIAIKHSTGKGLTLTYTDGTQSGPNSALAIDNGNVLPAGLLLRVTNDFGAYLQLQYRSTLKLAVVQTSGSDSASYVFDANNHLKSATFSDLRSRQYVYYSEDASLPALNGSDGLLVRVLDELGTIYSKYGYDTTRRAVSTELAGGVDKYVISYPWATSLGVAQTISITNPRSIVQTATLTYVSSKLIRLTAQSAPGISTDSSALYYDSNGNPLYKFDFNNNVSCYSYDATSNYEVVRVEGTTSAGACSSALNPGAALPAGARKITTTWHPSLHLESRVASPGKLTTSVYNGQPDPLNGGAVASCVQGSPSLPNGQPIAVLCKQVEQATTDDFGSAGFAAVLRADVPARQQTWTYNQYGQVLTAKGPRTDVNDTTTYSYYSTTGANYGAGDLQQVANPLGQVISYPQYNANGQVLGVIDVNGITTANTYDSRQRLLSSTSGGRTTGYVYDPVGQLIQLTMADGTALSYAWDDAHRLTKVTDQAGNSVTYTLDNAGNRTQEQVKDYSGALSRTVTRAFDALNRVQQVVGAAQ